MQVTIYFVIYDTKYASSAIIFNQTFSPRKHFQSDMIWRDIYQSNIICHTCIHVSDIVCHTCIHVSDRLYHRGYGSLSPG